MIEQILQDLYIADKTLSITLLRYFNPVGAHLSGMIGESPQGIPNNLMPFITQVAVGKREKLSIFGNDWNTPDGTGVRDYIHVVDLARGHLAALEKVAGQKINYEFVKRREGDIAAVWADTQKVEKELDWRATKAVDDMCRDAYNWQSKNPNGYADSE